MNQIQLISKAQTDLQEANPKSSIRKYGLLLLKTHHEKIRKKHYLQYRNIILKIAFKHHRQYGINIDDLIAEGNLIYFECFQKYSEEQHCCRFSTYLFNNLQSKLRYFCRRAIRKSVFNIEIEELFNIEDKRNFEKKVLFDCSLSKKSKDIISTIFKDFDDFSFYMSGSRITKRDIISCLKNRGWKLKDISNSFAEISLLLKN